MQAYGKAFPEEQHLQSLDPEEMEFDGRKPRPVLLKRVH